MQTFKRILTYTKSYKLFIGLSALCSVTYVILNAFSVWLIGTMLSNIMTQNTNKIDTPSSINEHLNHFIQNMVGNGSSIERLKSLCLILIIIFILKNIFKH